MTKAAITAQALQLSPEDRFELAEELWNSVADHPDAMPLSDEMRGELDRRLAEHDADPTDVIPWEEVKREITGK